MCLAIPVKVVSLLENDEAIVVLDGIRKKISLALVDDVYIGDYVILHVGFALHKLDPDEAAITLELFREMSQYDTEVKNPLLVLDETEE
jgi:hydrogenase expression/formation protein HypC